jgi:DNA-binding response OmpR family regulator
MSESDSSSPGSAILIIEDDDDTAADVQVGLIGAGYLVQRATSADEALTTLKSTQADLILMSLMLPDTDGLILCSTLKAHFPAPVIVLNTRAREVDRVLALESGAADVLTTPVNRHELLGRVQIVVQTPISAQTQRG